MPGEKASDTAGQGGLRKLNVKKMLLSIVAGAVGALSMFFVPFLFVIPAFIVFLGMYSVANIIASCASAAVVAYLVGGTSALLILIPLMLPVIALVICMKMKVAWFETAMIACVAVTAGMYILITGPDIIAGRDAFYSVREMFEMMSVSMSEQLSILPEAMRMGFDEENLEEAMAIISAQLPIVLPSVICIIGAIGGFVNFVIAKSLCKKNSLNIRPMAVFSKWRIPRSFVFGLLTIWGGILLLSFTQFAAMDAVLPIVGVVTCVPFSIQGLSIYVFLMKRRRNLLSVWILVGAMVLFPVAFVPYAILMLVMFGIVEQVFHIRRRVEDRERA